MTDQTPQGLVPLVLGALPRTQCLRPELVANRGAFIGDVGDTCPICGSRFDDPSRQPFTTWVNMQGHHSAGPGRFLVTFNTWQTHDKVAVGVQHVLGAIGACSLCYIVTRLDLAAFDAGVLMRTLRHYQMTAGVPVETVRADYARLVDMTNIRRSRSWIPDISALVGNGRPFPVLPDDWPSEIIGTPARRRNGSMIIPLDRSDLIDLYPVKA